MNKDFSHIDKNNQPKMVDVSDKFISKRTATAQATMFLGREIVGHFNNNELTTKKGPVFQTAVIAGIQAVKRTAELIPMCHPLNIDGVQVDIQLLDEEQIEIRCTVTMEGKTGVEMEALHGVSTAALTVYDMCKAISHNMVIREIRLLEKKGGKSDFTALPNEGKK